MVNKFIDYKGALYIGGLKLATIYSENKPLEGTSLL